MPIYAFACADCGHHFDRLQKLSDPDPELCPECGAPSVTRQVTAASFRLAGSGWYETDFKKKGDKKHNLAGDSGKTTEKSDTSSGSGKAAEGPKADKTAPTPKPAKGTTNT